MKKELNEPGISNIMKEDWVECTFEEITESLKRGPFGGDLKKAYFVPKGYAVYEQQHAISNDFSNIRYFIDDERYKLLQACNVEAGDYIVSCSGTMGKIARVPKNSPKGVINQALLRIRLNEKIINQNYFLKFFRSSIFQAKILKDSRGSGMQNMAGIKEIKPIKIQLPPLPIQRAIVSKIETLFSDLDNGINDLKKAQTQLKIYRQAVLEKAFEGELTKEWREKQTNLPTADELLEQIKEERQKHYEQQLENWKKVVEDWEENVKGVNKPKKPKKYSESKIVDTETLKELAIIPKGWLWIKNIDLAVKITDGEHITPKRTNSGYYLLSARNIQNGYIEYKTVDYVGQDEYDRIRKRCNPEFGDIMISCSGSVGRISHVPKDSEFVMVRSVALVKYTGSASNYKYFEYLYQSPIIQPQIEKGKKATAQANLFLGPIGNFDIIICSKEEQQQIVREIESRLSVCDKVEQSIKEGLEKAEALRQSILKKAFEGKLLSQAEIEKCKQEEDYKPAGVLLKRIKQEKKK